MSKFKIVTYIPTEPPKPIPVTCYLFPLGANDVELILTGAQLTPEDFDGLIEISHMFKKQFEKLATASEKQP